MIILYSSLAILCLVTSTEAQAPRMSCDGARFGEYAYDPADPSCSSYLWCLGRPVKRKCYFGLIFDLEKKFCNWKWAVTCPIDGSDGGNSKSPEPTTTTTTTPSGTTDLPELTTPFLDPCTKPGAKAFYPYPGDCGSYYMCDNGIGLRRRCPANLRWNQQGLHCDWPEKVDCTRDDDGGNSGTEATTTPRPNDTTDTTDHTTDGNDDGGGNGGGGGGSPNGGDCGRIVCYFTNWAQYRQGKGKFLPENIDPFHCTHIVYAFAKMQGNQLRPYEWNDDSTDWMVGRYAQIMKLKTENPDLKVLLAVGGWNMASAPFTAMVAAKESRQEFISTSITFLRTRNFDGLDLDWEYPANRGSPPGDKDKFSLLLKETYAAFQSEARGSSKSRLLLTAAVAAGKSTVDTAYDIPQLAKYLDFANLMTYDLHGAWETTTGHNSPLFQGSSEQGPSSYLNVDWAARYWVSRGFPKENLVLGVPFYGRTFTLSSASNSGVGSPVRGAGQAGTYTREAGFVAYYEVCEYIKNGGKVSRIEDMRVPFVVYNSVQWVGYDDARSLTEKVNYILDNKYGGAMIWSIGMDDFSGTCCDAGTYPLMKAVRKACRVRE